MSSENIHIKLQVQNNYRRFFVNQKIKFSELKNKISSLLGLNSDFLIKYLDEENEWITITSDMELETGLSLYNQIFRLLIEPKDITQSLISIPTPLQTSTFSTTNITPLANSNNSVTQTESLISPLAQDNSISSVSNAVSTSTPVAEDNELGTSAEKPWRKHRRNKEERRDWKEEKKKGGRRGGRGGRGGRRGRRGGKKHFDNEGSSTSESFEDEGISVDEAKKRMNSLTEELTGLIEKKKSLKGEVDTLLESVRKEKESANYSDSFYELKNQLKEKKLALRTLNGQIKASKNRITNLRGIVLTGKNE